MLRARKERRLHEARGYVSEGDVRVAERKFLI
jgi:hypothetical protein